MNASPNWNPYTQPSNTMRIPSAPEAEDAVLASCTYSGNIGTFDEISTIITADDFYDSSNARIFQSLCNLSNSGNEINEITIADDLRKTNDLDTIGGMSRLFGIMDSPSTHSTGVTSARIVRDNSRARQLQRMYKLKLEDINEGTELADITASTEAELRKIMADSGESNTLEDASKELKERLHSMLDGTYVAKKIPTGIDHLDEKLDEGGIGQGEVCVIAAPTSCGKSQLALNFVLRASIVDNVPSMIFSFEMPANQLAKRMTQTASAVNLKSYTNGTATPHQRDLVDNAIDKVAQAPIYTEHTVRGIDDLRSKARMIKRKHDVKVIVIDYLQLIPFNAKLSKHEGISQASHGIKQMAMELDVAVILLAQINRTGAMRDSGLVLYDLKDSGDIENDADIALLMWPNGGSIDHCRRTGQNGVTYLEMDYNVAKNREGERDLMGRFKFLNHIGRFQ
jgi:replicative DNA helicase